MTTPILLTLLAITTILNFILALYIKIEINNLSHIREQLKQRDLKRHLELIDAFKPTRPKVAIKNVKI